MRRTRSRRKIKLGGDVSALPNMMLIKNIQTPPRSPMRRRSMGTPGLASIPTTPNHTDSPNRTLNETFSPEPEEKVFSVRTLLDSIQKHKRHTSSSIGNSIEYDTPRVTRASSSLMAKSRTSIKKSNKESPVMASLKKLVTKTPKSNIFETIEHVSDMVAVEDRIIKSIRKHRRSNTIIDTLASEKKNVKFHSPANMEVSTFDIDIKMQSDRKGKKRLRSLSNAETEKDKVKLKNSMTPEKKVEKNKTPRSRKKMPNFTEIHQRQFDKMESITEHAARKAERAKILHRSPKTIAKTETVDIEEPETVIVCEPEPEIMSPHESSTVRQSEPEVLQESKVEVLEAPETEVVQQLEDTVVQEPVAVIMLEPELNVANNTELINEEPEPMLFFEPEAENENLDDIEPPSDVTSSTISAFAQSPFVADNLHFKQLISKSNLSPMTEHEKHRASSLVGRSPFDVVKLESVSFQPKIPLIQKRPIAISRIPGKMKLAEKNLTLNRLKVTKPDLNTTVTKIPQPKFNSTVLGTSNKNSTTNLNTSNVFVFKANKTVSKKPVPPVPESSKVKNQIKTENNQKPNLKRTKSMVAVKPKPLVIPMKENHVDKVKERQQKNMSLYKGRPEPEVKTRPAGPKNMIAVRTNKRFELQMKFRQMNSNN